MKRMAWMAMVYAVACVACYKAAPVSAPITTVAAVEATDLFTGMSFVLDSTNSTPAWRVYRAGGRTMGRLVKLRLSLAPNGGVSAVRLAMPPAVIRSMSMLLRAPYADLVSAVMAPADTTAFAPLLAQLRDDLMGAAAGKFLMRDTTSRSMPLQPTPLYLAFLNAQSSAVETHGGSLVTIENLSMGADTATVLTVTASGNAMPPVSAADLVAKTLPDLLGGTADNVDASPFIEAARLGSGQREGREITYRSADGRDLMTLSARLDAASLVDRLTLTYANPGDVLGDTDAARMALSMVSNLVPHGDSASVAAIKAAGLLGTTGLESRTYHQINEALTAKQGDVEFDLPRCHVRIGTVKGDHVAIEIAQLPKR